MYTRFGGGSVRARAVLVGLATAVVALLLVVLAAWSPPGRPRLDSFELFGLVLPVLGAFVAGAGAA